jgi:hypothetical protein
MWLVVTFCFPQEGHKYWYLFYKKIRTCIRIFVPSSQAISLESTHAFKNILSDHQLCQVSIRNQHFGYHHCSHHQGCDVNQHLRIRVTLQLIASQWFRLGFEPLLGLMASILICSSHFITEGQSILASSPFWDSRAAFNLSLSLYNWQWVSESVLASSPFWDSWPYFNLFQSLYNWR